MLAVGLILETMLWGNDIYVELTYHDTIPVDTIDDLKKVRLLLKEQQ